jgi:protein-S-isoprenylcysteine O-methyltransferase Ste14
MLHTLRFSSKCRLFRNATFFGSCIIHILHTECVEFKVKFKVCKSVHHRTIQINGGGDATIFQFIILTFVYSSTCSGRFPAHNQELTDCSGGLWLYLYIVVTAVLLVVVGPAGPTTTNSTLRQ